MTKKNYDKLLLFIKQFNKGLFNLDYDYLDKLGYDTDEFKSLFKKLILVDDIDYFDVFHSDKEYLGQRFIVDFNMIHKRSNYVDLFIRDLKYSDIMSDRIYVGNEVILSGKTYTIFNEFILNQKHKDNEN